MKEKLKKIVKELNKKYAGKKLKVVMREPYYIDEDLGEKREEESFACLVKAFTFFEKTQTEDTRVTTSYEHPLAAPFGNEKTFNGKPEVYYGIAALVEGEGSGSEVKEMVTMDSRFDDGKDVLFHRCQRGVYTVNDWTYEIPGPAVLEVSVL